MKYQIGDVVTANTADIVEGAGYEHMIVMKDDSVTMTEWWGFFFTVTEHDLERLRSRRKIKLKVTMLDTDARVIFAEAPQSPPELRWYHGPTYCMGFESQAWGRYSWLN